ncbi:hypothetical protein LRS03_20240 [Rhizobacter sp. J219]|uniref:VIT domain-containing protein n=1 Tax=Rhizobacter sp. J219 TaxID=2898430 RepID=UPI0021514E11|nr:VIT domain-containing protein [Rhizobacter sp. J219]MCR5885064.1 hypothetical protein [Rhizobacter sp. J219]
MATAALTSAPLTRRSCLSALVGACAAPSVLALAPPARPFEPPVLRMRLQDTGAEPVRVQRASVQAEVVGHAAQMRVELVFFNPNGRVLEGELQFPLAHGQWVSGFEARHRRRAAPRGGGRQGAWAAGLRRRDPGAGRPGAAGGDRR